MGVGSQCHNPATLPLGKRTGTHCKGDWEGPGPLWMGVENLTPYQDSIPGPSSLYQAAILTELSWPHSTIYFAFMSFLNSYPKPQINDTRHTTDTSWPQMTDVWIHSCTSPAQVMCMDLIFKLWHPSWYLTQQPLWVTGKAMETLLWKWTAWKIQVMYLTM